MARVIDLNGQKHAARNRGDRFKKAAWLMAALIGLAIILFAKYIF